MIIIDCIYTNLDVSNKAKISSGKRNPFVFIDIDKALPRIPQYLDCLMTLLMKTTCAFIFSWSHKLPTLSRGFMYKPNDFDIKDSSAQGFENLIYWVCFFNKRKKKFQFPAYFSRTMNRT